MQKIPAVGNYTMLIQFVLKTDGSSAISCRRSEGRDDVVVRRLALTIATRDPITTAPRNSQTAKIHTCSCLYYLTITYIRPLTCPIVGRSKNPYLVVESQDQNGNSGHHAVTVRSLEATTTSDFDDST